MLLVKLIDGVDIQYVSNETHDIEHFYEPRVASLGQLRVATREVYGGFAEPAFGQIDLLPTVFTDSWPPPAQLGVVISVGATGESDAYIVFQGAAYLNEIARDSVKYDLHGPEYSEKVTDYVYSGTLLYQFQVACPVLGLTLDSTYARAVSPDVDWQADGERLIVDNLNDLAKFFSHRFYILGTTLYLIDCLRSNGTALTLTEFDIFPSSYTSPTPLKKVTAKHTPDITQYRISNTVTQVASSFLGFAEIELRSIVDGVDQTSVIGGTATAYNSHASYPPANAVDDNAATYFRSSTISLSYMYWQFAFSSVPDPIVEYQITGHSTPGYSPVSWDVLGYDIETASWREIKKEKTESDWTAGEVRKFALPVPSWDVVVYGQHPAGEEVAISPVCHTARADIDAALMNIKNILEMPRVRLIMPIEAIPSIGREIALIDESLYLPTQITAKVQARIWDFDQMQCVVEGEGELSLYVAPPEEDGSPIYITDADGPDISDADGALIIEAGG